MSELVLGIESSCDETAAAVVRAGREVLSSVIASQIAEHAPFGGVVPEIAGRSHLRAVLPTIDRALEEAHASLDDLAAIAVTTRPGLIGSLLVGLSAAKGLAYARGLPLVAVDHIEAHAYAAVMEWPDDAYPNLTLVASGGHTALYDVRSPTELTRISETRDDSAGEAFDKVAHLLGLPYPGGPSIARLAEEGDPKKIAFPRYRTKRGEPDFSFSGLKTAVLYHLRGQDALARTPAPDAIQDRADVAASFQAAAIDALVAPTLEFARRRGLATIAVVGGVASNKRLRERMLARAEELGIRCLFPSPVYCTDNAAMIAGLGWRLFQAGATSDLALDASPR
ncbi:MAG TPA: tRNA (adenosine(37)-N6)-threonylcarbamoyltransferase complex transferase subunit TsaD [Planctomycetota bacterium]|nr:tRNA (adenosine(37)-N6)-threonylcarbamoyltransferase complex transferase subunit TsaD [Planctomycetota bacterium]